MGALFALAVWNPTGINFTRLDRIEVINGWFVFAAAVLIFWGSYRAIRPHVENPPIGQDTLNFVVAIVGATFAILGFLAK